MKLFKLIFKSLLISSGVFLLLLFVLAFWRLSGLFGQDLNQGGDAYFDLAPDGQYMTMRVYFQDDESLIHLVLNKEKEVIYVSKFRDEADAPLHSPLWMSYEGMHVQTYDYVAMSYMTEVPLPVPFYERWYAWLFMNARNVDLDKLEMIPD